MRNILRKVFIVVALFATINTDAQINLGDILGRVRNSASGAGESGKNSEDGLISAITGVFQKNKIATEDRIVGTWIYEGPAVIFTSDNMLKKAGGKLFSSLIEKKLQEELEKYGFKKGVVSLVFDKDGKFTQKINGKNLKGTYTIKDKNIVLKYGGSISQIAGTTQLDGDSLLIVMDVSKLLKYIDALGQYTNNSTLKTATSLLGGMDGMECGIQMKKQ